MNEVTAAPSDSVRGRRQEFGVMENTCNTKPITYQRNLAKLPKALAPLIERKQWAVWRWTQKPDGSWQKPPFMALEPERHASTSDPATWADYSTALATVQAGDADGLSYILTKDDPFGAIDLDHCRCTITNSIDVWAQNYLQAAVNTYQEITPSGVGVRIWGFADGNSLNRKFTLNIEGKDIAAELFRKTNKALTVTGYTLDPAVRELSNIDNVFDWALVWASDAKLQQQNKPHRAKVMDLTAADASTASTTLNRSCVKVRRRGLTALTCFTPWWGTMSDVAGM